MKVGNIRILAINIVKILIVLVIVRIAKMVNYGIGNNNNKTIIIIRAPYYIKQHQDEN